MKITVVVMRVLLPLATVIRVMMMMMMMAVMIVMVVVVVEETFGERSHGVEGLSQLC